MGKFLKKGKSKIILKATAKINEKKKLPTINKCKMACNPYYT